MYWGTFKILGLNEYLTHNVRTTQAFTLFYYATC